MTIEINTWLIEETQRGVLLVWMSAQFSNAYSHKANVGICSWRNVTVTNEGRGKGKQEIKSVAQRVLCRINQLAKQSRIVACRAECNQNKQTHLWGTKMVALLCDPHQKGRIVRRKQKDSLNIVHNDLRLTGVHLIAPFVVRLRFRTH